MSNRFTILYFVNSILTCSFENLPKDEVYKNAVPTEALLPIEGSRWHSLTKNTVNHLLNTLPVGQRFKIAYQMPPSNHELDIETIYVEKN